MISWLQANLPTTMAMRLAASEQLKLLHDLGADHTVILVCPA